MDQTRLPTALADHRQIGTFRGKKICQRILVSSGKTMGRHARRLVHHQHGIIFVYDRHSKLGLGDGSRQQPMLSPSKRYLITRKKFVSFFSYLSVNPEKLAANGILHCTTREL